MRTNITDKWIDTTTLVIAFRNFADPTKDGIICATKRSVKDENMEAQKKLFKKKEDGDGDGDVHLLN